MHLEAIIDLMCIIFLLGKKSLHTPVGEQCSIIFVLEKSLSYLTCWRVTGCS